MIEIFFLHHKRMDLLQYQQTYDEFDDLEPNALEIGSLKIIIDIISIDFLPKLVLIHSLIETLQIYI